MLKSTLLAAATTLCITTGAAHATPSLVSGFMNPPNATTPAEVKAALEHDQPTFAQFAEPATCHDLLPFVDVVMNGEIVKLMITKVGVSITPRQLMAGDFVGYEHGRESLFDWRLCVGDPEAEAKFALSDKDKAALARVKVSLPHASPAAVPRQRVSHDAQNHSRHYSGALHHGGNSTGPANANATRNVLLEQHAGAPEGGGR